MTKKNVKFELHRLCAESDPLAVKEAALKNRSDIRERDSKRLTPIHIDCANCLDEGPEILDALLSINPLAANQVNIRGQLPLHIACANEGPFDHDLLLTQEHSNPCVVRLVKSLLRVNPAAAAEQGAHEAVEMLLEAFPDSALSDPYGLGGLGIRHSWKEVVSVLSSPDNLLGRQATLSSCVLPVARVWADGHRVVTPHTLTPLSSCACAM